MIKKPHVWYVRRDREIRGPFPAGMITRHILLGRIVDTDQLSPDQRDWRLVTALPELIPDEMKADLDDPENQERLRIARLREDERQAGDRRQDEAIEADLPDDIRRKRTGDERRESETYEAVRHREIKTEFRQNISRPGTENYQARIILLILFIVAIGAMAVKIGPGYNIAVNLCDSVAGKGVNWSNCFKEGEDLAGRNLSGAMLGNSQLSAVDMSRAVLNAARMNYANMSRANAQFANFSGASMLGVVGRNADFSGAILVNVDLSYAILQGANLSNANLTNADLTHVVLNGAQLEGAVLTGAKLDKAIWIDNTVCAPESVGRCIPIPRTAAK